MSDGSFVCNTCDHSFACEELLIAHNRTHVKTEKNSAYNEFEVSVPRTSISEIRSQTSICVKEEPFSSVQSESEVTTSETSNQSSISDTLNQSSSLLKEEPCNSVQSASEVSTSLTSVSDAFSQNSSRIKDEPCPNNLLQQSNATCAKRNPERFFTCDKCNKCFMYQNLLTDHYRMHVKLEATNSFENYYAYSKTQGLKSCNVCNINFEGKGERKKHFYAVHGKKNLCCDGCSQRFDKLKKLVRHTRRCCKEKLVKCDVCSKGFLKNKDLKHHYRIHVGENTRGWYMAKSEPLTVIGVPALAKKEPILCKPEPMEE